MNKTLSIILGILFVTSGVFNFFQHGQIKVVKEKLSFFESTFGSYDAMYELAKQAKEAEEKIRRTITVYLKTGATEPQVTVLKDAIENQGSVQSIQYISAEQAWKDFRSNHQKSPEILKALDDLRFNPFFPTLSIKITDVTQKQSLINFIEANDKISIIDRIDS